MQGENLNSNSKTPEITEIKNVILLIGDGMGTTYTTAYRYYKDNLTTSIMEKTSFDPYLVGLQTTYSFDEDHNITDSAAAATSLSSGIKTYNGAIGVDMHEDDVKTVLEVAKELGKSTGLIATSTINHATPAAFGAHNKSRKNYSEIANDYYDDLVNGKHKVDILLGGGRNEFVRKDRNLVEEFKKDGYAFVTTRKELLENQNEQVIGLFAEGALPKMIDRSKETPSLEDMTLAALKQLNKNENGFFLMVEGSQIDWGGHDNDIVSVMSEMEDFEKAFKAAIDFAIKDKHTLVIATGDHETGGLSVGSGSDYNWNFEIIKQVTRTPSFIANKLIAQADVEKTLKKYIKFSLTREEVNKVIDKVNSNPAGTVKTIASIINKRSNTGWTTNGHTGQDVPVYAFGPGSALFAGLTDNTETAKNIIKMLNLSH
ncbi:alkaline phosphatase [Lottiidibacillus patelloidae]|nr:alkaline phosphatase [Lottiidibacillus patelloidae]